MVQRRQPDMPQLPFPEVTAAEVTKLQMLRHALTKAKSVFSAAGPFEDRIKTIAGEYQELGAPADHPQYESAVLSQLCEVVPISDYPNTKTHRPQDSKLIDLVSSNQRGFSMQQAPPKGLVGRSAHLAYVNQVVLTDCLVRSQLVQPHRGRLGWRAGVVTAAAYYRADILNPVDRRVYDQWTDIVEYARQYGADVVANWRKRGFEHASPYTAIERAVKGGAAVVELAGVTAPTHEHIWREVQADAAAITASMLTRKVSGS